MAYLTLTAMDFMKSEDWSRRTVGELHDALLESTYSTLPDAVQGRASDAKRFWMVSCKPNIDYLLYMYCDPLGTWPMEKTIAECVNNHRLKRLNKGAKRALFVYYFNAYLYKYISIELGTIEQIVSSSTGMTYEMAVEHFITTLLYPGIDDAHPGQYLGFERMEFIPEGRKQSLRADARDLCVAHNSADVDGMYRTMFLLMTYYAGSVHRRVHDAMTTILGIDMVAFRGLFFENLSNIIDKKGAVMVSGIE